MRPRGIVAPAVCLSLGLSALVAGTPVDSTATFVPPDEVRLSWPSVTGQSYQVTSTTDLAMPWTTYVTDPAIVVAAGEELAVNVPVADAVRFFLVVKLDAEPQPVPGMVWIPPGTFTMGSPGSERGRLSDEGPQTEVTISRGFWLGKYELTQREYESVMGSNPSTFKGDLERPVERMSWYNAVAYCEALAQRERSAGRLPAGYEYRLPTEAQWEYACRAGTTSRFSFGDALGCNNDTGCSFCAEVDQYMVWCGNDNSRTERVGTRLPNPWGLYDMHGNVWEWCADWWRDSLPGGSVIDPTGPNTGSNRVYRGGCWNDFALYCRSARRYGLYPSFTSYGLGFRVALVPVP